jgi:hypothetical protein
VDIQEELERAADEAYGLIREFAICFERGMGDENGSTILIDYDALRNIARSYVDDVHRYATYHETQVPDRARRSAYLCKWLMKFRPIVVTEVNGNGSEEIRTVSLMANELFALACVSGLMEFDWNGVSDRVRQILLYALRHRNNSEDTYILFFAQINNL